ncbi:MAG: DUF4911 domain-containing protein [Desulfovibrio sp.]|jgi:hypothetical protein|nr:DUF4911 domain-containing protein [Desulfovibrio sp.]
MTADKNCAVRMPPVPALFPKRKKRRKTRLGVPPGRSSRLYVVVEPSAVGLFRYLLEAHDNLGLMTVLDRRRAALLLRFAPGMEKEMREFVESVKAMLPCSDPVKLPGAEPSANCGTTPTGKCSRLLSLPGTLSADASPARGSANPRPWADVSGGDG